MTLPNGVDQTVIRRNFMLLNGKVDTLFKALSALVIDEEDGMLVADDVTTTLVIDEDALS